MSKLSVAIATYNEEENIGRCLASVKDLADEIVVVDGSSTDKTTQIAKKYGAKVTVTDNPPIFHINKQKAIDQCSGSWILQLDADEEIPSQLAKEIQNVVKKGSRYNAFYLKRKNYFLGRWLKKGGQYPDPVIRFFKKGKAHLPCQSVHEQMVVKGRVGTLKNEMLHHTAPTLSRYLTNANRYTSLTADELEKQNLGFNFLNHLQYFCFKPKAKFLSLFFRHKGFRDGFQGFVFALFSAIHFPLAYIKYWEKIRKKRKAKERKIFLLILLLSLLGLIARFLFLWKFSTAFTYDQARDLLDLREMMLLKKLRLIGPTTSIQGVFFGPLWYWLAFPFYLISAGHPTSTLWPIILMSFFIPLLIYFLLEDRRLAFFLGFLFIFSSPAFSRSSYALNPNFLIFLTPLILLLLAKFFQKETFWCLFWAAFLAGAALHFQVVVAILWLPLFFSSAFILKKLKALLRYKMALIGYLLPLFPQILFELRHGFLQTESLVSLILRGEHSLLFHLANRIKIFIGIFRQVGGENLILTGILAVLTAFLIYQFQKEWTYKKKDEFFYLTSIGFIFLLIIFLWFIFYPFAIQSWHVVDIEVLTIMVIGLALYSLFRKGKMEAIISLILLFLVGLFGVRPNRLLPFEKFASPDPANLRTRIQVVDLIYQDAGGRGFNLFTFAPYVYDYPYQYLIWWRAKTKYYYLPEEYFYLSNQPKYLVAKAEADRLIASKKAECDYLIIEPYESQEKWYHQWRGNFPEAKKSWQIGQTRVEKLCLEK